VRLSIVNILPNADKTTITYSDLVVFVKNIRPTILHVQTTVTAGSKVLLQKVIAAQLDKIFPVFYGSEFTAVFKKAHSGPLSSAS
jgi:hypothetical protein